MREIVIVVMGMAAIVAEEHLDCRIKGETVDTAPFQIIMFNPPKTQHRPFLWVKADAVVPAPTGNKCFTDKPRTRVPCGDLTTQWIGRPLARAELVLRQVNDVQSKVEQKYRKCWTGKDATTADNCWISTDCKKDASWIPEFARASGGGVLRPEVVNNPAAQRGVVAFVRNVRGTLEATELGDKEWYWDWNADCDSPPGVPDYVQKFSQAASISGVQLEDTDSLVVRDKYGEGVDTITLKPNSQNGGDPWQVQITNMPVDGTLIPVGNKCFLPHFKHFAMFTESSACYREPYVKIDEGDDCPEALGLDNPYCPPVVIKSGG